MDAFDRFARTVAAAIALMTLLPTPSLPEQIPALCNKERDQAAMTRCADEHLKKAKAELAASLKQLLAETDKDNHNFVAEAQSAWESYRDKECISRIGGSPNRGGSIWPMMQLQCHTNLTRARIKDLKEQAKCPGGRMEC